MRYLHHKMREESTQALFSTASYSAKALLFVSSWIEKGDRRETGHRQNSGSPSDSTVLGLQ